MLKLEVMKKLKKKFTYYHGSLILLLLIFGFAKISSIRFLYQSDQIFTSVIILGRARSGSTLVANLLNIHNVVYYHEPISMIEIKLKSFINHTTVMTDLLKCNLHPTYAKELLTQFSLYDELCSLTYIPDLCENNLNNYWHLCASYFKVIKTISLDLQDADKAIVSSQTKTGIVHLVRDPRAIVASRAEFKSAVKKDPPPTIIETQKSLCDRMARELHYLIGNENLRKRTIVVKYENLVLYPTRVAKGIYKFIGRSYSSIVDNRVKSKLVIKPENKSTLNLISTDRDSKTRLERWKKSLSFQAVLKIQNDCREVIELLGYKLIRYKYEMNESFDDDF